MQYIDMDLVISEIERIIKNRYKHEHTFDRNMDMYLKQAIELMDDPEFCEYMYNNLTEVHGYD